MKIGIRLHDTVSGTLEERLNHVKGQGFECAHLALSKVIPGFSMKDAPEKLSRPEFGEEIRDPFVRTGLDCALLGCYLSLMDNSEEERERIRAIYYAHLSFAGKIGAWMVGSETPARASRKRSTAST